jgi:hypothetical protein
MHAKRNWNNFEEIPPSRWITPKKFQKRARKEMHFWMDEAEKEKRMHKEGDWIDHIADTIDYRGKDGDGEEEQKPDEQKPIEEPIQQKTDEQKPIKEPIEQNTDEQEPIDQKTDKQKSIEKKPIDEFESDHEWKNEVEEGIFEDLREGIRNWKMLHGRRREHAEVEHADG